ncbi:MAG: fluoride efflux transporter FluC [Haloechinothrix sp.]
MARYGLSLAFPAVPGEFPVATLLANVVGCVLIGALMAVITESACPHRLLRPFVGIGVLGGFTTFSTYVVEVIDAVNGGSRAMALGYALGTVLLCLAAVVTGLALTRAQLRPRVARPEVAP